MTVARFLRPALRVGITALLLAACSNGSSATTAGASATVGAGGDAVGGGGSGGGASSGAGGAPAACEPGSGAKSHALVAAIVPDTGSAYLTAYTLEGGGRIVDPGVAPIPVVGPQRLAFSPSGKEVVVAYGTFATNYGVLVLDVAPDASSLTLRQDLVLGEGMIPQAVVWASEEHVVVATLGGVDGHQLIDVVRSGKDDFVVGKAADIPGNWPIGLARRPGIDGAGQVVLLRGDLLGGQDTTDVRAFALGAQGWTSAGTSVAVTPAAIRFGVHPSGLALYAPSDDPEARPAPDRLTPPGILHRMRFAGDDVVSEPSYALPHVGSLLSVAPSGDFLVTQQPVFTVAGNGVAVASYRIETVTLDGKGAPTAAFSSAEGFTAQTIDAFELTGDGLLVLGLTVAAEEPADAHPLLVWRQGSPGQWGEACERFKLPGLAVLAVH
jgi:hypothetical protein